MARCSAALCLTLAATASAQLPDHPAISQTSTPNWIVEQPLSEPEKTDGEEIAYLLVDQQIRLEDRGPQQVYRRFSYRIESRTALEEWSSWQIGLEPSFEKLQLHELRVRRDGAWQGRLERSRASMLQREADLDQQIFDGRQTLLLVFDDIRVGDVVDISYSLIGSNPLFGGRFDFASWLGWSLPVARAHLRLSYPSRRPVQVIPLAGAPEPERTRQGGRTVLHWLLEDLPLIEGESGTPPSTLTYPLVDMSEYQSWAEVVDWGVPIYRLQRAPDLDEIAAPWLEEHESPFARLAAARNWVQDEIRYFAAVMGPHSHAPHAPADILARRYGDCKDKTLLLIHLLDKLGIEAWPALVHTENGFGLPDRLPSPGLFDHVITVASIDGQEVWIDPTLSLQGGTEALYVPPYGYGLELREGQAELTPIEVPDGAIPSTDAVYTYSLKDTSGAVETVIRTVYSGREAESLRQTLASTAIEDLQTGYVDFYASDTFKVSASRPLEIKDDRAANSVEVLESYRVDYTDPGGEIAFSVLPLLLESDLGYPEDLENRKAPWQIPYPLRRREAIVLESPDADTYSSVEMEEDNDFFHFKVSTQRRPTSLRLTYQLETKVPQVAAADLPDYAAAVDRMWAELGYGVWTDEANIVGDASLRPHALMAYGTAAALLLIYAGALAVFLRYRGLLGGAA